jgi:hypothetical protein
MRCSSENSQALASTCAQCAESVPVCVTYQPTRRKRFRWVMGVKGTKELTKGRHRPIPQNDRHGAPPPAGGMPMPSLTAHRVPYDGRRGRRAMPLEAWQPGRTVVAAALRAGEMGAAEPNSASDRDFLRTWDGYWLCWLDEAAESFFIRHGILLV